LPRQGLVHRLRKDPEAIAQEVRRGRERRKDLDELVLAAGGFRHHVGVFVAVIERRSVGEKVDIHTAVRIPNLGPEGGFEYCRHAAALSAGGTFAAFESGVRQV